MCIGAQGKMLHWYSGNKYCIMLKERTMYWCPEKNFALVNSEYIQGSTRCCASYLLHFWHPPILYLMRLDLLWVAKEYQEKPLVSADRMGMMCSPRSTSTPYTLNWWSVTMQHQCWPDAFKLPGQPKTISGCCRGKIEASFGQIYCKSVAAIAETKGSAEPRLRNFMLTKREHGSTVAALILTGLKLQMVLSDKR